MYMTIKRFNPTISNTVAQNINHADDGGMQQPVERKAPMNIIELEDRYEVYLMMPGFSKEDVKISISDDILTVKANIKVQENANFKVKEFGHASLVRSMALSDKLMKDNIDAEMSNGILKLTIKKAPEIKPRFIQVR